MITIKTAAVVYWSQWWRGTLVTVLLVSFIAGILAAVAKDQTAYAANVIKPFGLGVFVLVQIWATQKAILANRARLLRELGIDPSPAPTNAHAIEATRMIH